MSAGNISLERHDALRKIGELKKALGKDLLILAHFYQHDDIVRFADFVGDSLQLAEEAARNRDARYIVFCSVSFMAETARILCSEGQEVLNPEPRSRCSLADMAAPEQVEAAWSRLSALNKTIVPVVYVNSNPDLKAFCARKGGMVCTSANVKKAFTHVLSRGGSVFFFPDGNMGRNISRDLGLGEEEVFLWDPDKGSVSPGQGDPDRGRVFLWPGFCVVHKVMGRSDIEGLRKEHEGIRVVVHPECTPEVYVLADYAGSTSFIKKMVETSEPGSKWAIGTEWNFVNRIKAENPDKLILPLREERCEEMGKTTPDLLLETLLGLTEGRLVNRVVVDPDVAREAAEALRRMLELG